MTGNPILQRGPVRQVLLGDEAAALGAVHAGVTAAYAYPGTPSTEVMEYLIRLSEQAGKPVASWCANEKTAFEEALGVSMVGRRSLVVMKHVGLNVAADPFMNGAIVQIHGGLVVLVADDPGMHSSQNEQDSRYFADFARVPCLEPANQQEAYEMVREAFELSEQFHVPVMVRLVTRLAHSRAAVRPQPPLPERALRKPRDTRGWTLLPAYARMQWRDLLDRQPDMLAYSEATPNNQLFLNPERHELGVITTGLARNYYLENLGELRHRPSHLHIGAYPLPVDRIRELAAHVDKLLVLEEGNPYLERYLRGILPQAIRIEGKLSGHIPQDGELNPDFVRKALDLPGRPGVSGIDLPVRNRPPQLCQGCPHADSYAAICQALEGHEESLVAADIGCYTLGALPPYSAIESCVCMGASIGMAKGAAEAGIHPAFAVIGDSTFLHSGVTPLIDAVAADADIVVVILDNGTVGMTGGQPTMLPSSRIEPLVRGLGVDPEHLHVLHAHPKRVEEMAEVFRREIAHRGLSVVIAARECIETAKRRRREEKKGEEA